MSSYSLTPGLYLYPTPAGAYHAVCSKEASGPRQFLRQLLGQRKTRELSLENLQMIMGYETESRCLDVLQHCQKQGWVQGLNSVIEYPDGPLEEILPGFLSKISENGKVLLADRQGFYLASHGFKDEAAEELSGLSAELAIVHDRRSELLNDNLGFSSRSWALVDAFGNSQIGFWPLFIGQDRFVLAISGIPHFNQPEFVSLVWTLTMRYAT